MIEDELIALRRYFHKHAEPAWMEFKTTEKIIKELENYDIDLYYGKDIYYKKRLGLRKNKKYESYRNSVSIDLANKKDEILDSYTGLIGVIDSKIKGPNIGFRFDIDANDLKESTSKGHIPNIKNFSSINDFAMHACGHDAHTAIGISLCKYLSKNKDKLRGKLIFIFQPAEEGVRGAHSLMDNPLIKNLDYMAGLHIGMDVDSGDIVVGSRGFLATKKLDITFKGKSSHAGAKPEDGHNALLAAASAALNFNSLSQHSKGMTRINVGRLNAGSGRNIIANFGKIEMEIRSDKQEIIDYLYEGVERIVKGVSYSYQCKYEIETVGSAPNLDGYDKDFIRDLRNFYRSKNYKLVSYPMKGSEDVTYLLNKVNRNGGRAVHFILGSNLKSGHHTEDFDINEKDLIRGFNILVDFVKYILKVEDFDFYN